MKRIFKNHNGISWRSTHKSY